MKTLMIGCLIGVLILAAVPVMACGDGDKGKDEKVFVPGFQTLCGGDKGDKPVPKRDPQCGDGDKDKDEKAFMPSFQPLCGGDKGDKPVPKPEPQCGGGKDKKDKDTKA